MKKLILTFGIILASQFGIAQTNAAKSSVAVDDAFKNDVVRVVERSSASGQLASAKKQILGMIPEEKHAAFLVEFDALTAKVQESTVKIYMDEYSKEDVKAMLAFYDSPVGKKMAEKAETIATKSQEEMMSLQGEMQALVMKYMQ